MQTLSSSSLFNGNHIQILLPLSHVVSVFTSSKKGFHWDTKINYNITKDELEVSLERASKSLKSILESGQWALEKNIISSYKKPSWYRNYVSLSSFNSNKLDSLFYSVSNPFAPSILSFQLNLKTNQGFIFNRGFKTRSHKVPLSSSSIKMKSSHEQVVEKKQSKIKEKLEGIRSSPLLKPKEVREAYKSTKLQSLISNTDLSPEEIERIKVMIAFAEGYILGSPKKSKPRVLTIIKEVMTFIILVVLLSLLASDFTGSSFRRVLLGNANQVHPEEINVTFDDVMGVQEAKQELQEVVEFLKNPEKFSALGGKLPKGVLLVGPPGTGKTLLARAVAGEASVPFFHAAGPEFDEVLVGQGARRVRDLFNSAKSKAPCVIFIDEIDSVGAKRTNSLLHPYANQTINQLLTEMDGFRQNEGVVVLGATNRRDDLDKALLRPGRFDVEVHVQVPDLRERKEILNLYLSKVKISNDVDADILAKRTIGFTGADIENMVNQAALRAAIDGENWVSMKYFENARDKVLMGPERKNRIPDEEANRITAYHEGGHAIVAYFTKDATPLHKVTIVSRGQTLGHTSYIPDKENYHVTKAQMLALIDAAMGGRAAEELIFGSDKITSGSSNDIKEATSIATKMVKIFGMSDKVGLRTFEQENKGLVATNELSESTTESIDSEIKRILQESYERAKTILKNKSKEHRQLAEALLKYETLEAEEVKRVIEGLDPKFI